MDSTDGHKAYLKSHLVYCTQVFRDSCSAKKRENPNSPSEEALVLVERRVCVLYDATPAVAPHKAQGLGRHLAVLHVEQLQLAAVCR